MTLHPANSALAPLRYPAGRVDIQGRLVGQLRSYDSGRAMTPAAESCPYRWPRAIVLVDMNAFFAAVEQRDYPELRGRPVAVTNGIEGTTIITNSYEARARLTEGPCRSTTVSTIHLQQRPQANPLLPLRLCAFAVNSFGNGSFPLKASHRKGANAAMDGGARQCREHIVAYAKERHYAGHSSLAWLWLSGLVALRPKPRACLCDHPPTGQTHIGRAVPAAQAKAQRNPVVITSWSCRSQRRFCHPLATTPTGQPIDPFASLRLCGG